MKVQSVLRSVLFMFITTNFVSIPLHGNSDDCLSKLAGEKIAAGEFDSAVTFVSHIIDKSKREAFLKEIAWKVVEERKPETRNTKISAIVGTIQKFPIEKGRKELLATIAGAIMTEKGEEMPELSLEERFAIASSVLSKGGLPFKDVFQKYRENLDDVKLRNLLTAPDFSSTYGYTLEGSEIRDILGLLEPLAPELPISQTLVPRARKSFKSMKPLASKKQPDSIEVTWQQIYTLIKGLSPQNKNLLRTWVSEAVSKDRKGIRSAEEYTNECPTIELFIGSRTIIVTKLQVVDLILQYRDLIINLSRIRENSGLIPFNPSNMTFGANLQSLIPYAESGDVQIWANVESFINCLRLLSAFETFMSSVEIPTKRWNTRAQSLISGAATKDTVVSMSVLKSMTKTGNPNCSEAMEFVPRGVPSEAQKAFVNKGPEVFGKVLPEDKSEDTSHEISSKEELEDILPEVENSLAKQGTTDPEEVPHNLTLEDFLDGNVDWGVLYQAIEKDKGACSYEESINTVKDKSGVWNSFLKENNLEVVVPSVVYNNCEPNPYIAVLLAKLYKIKEDKTWKQEMDTAWVTYLKDFIDEFKKKVAESHRMSADDGKLVNKAKKWSILPEIKAIANYIKQPILMFYKSENGKISSILFDGIENSEPIIGCENPDPEALWIGCVENIDKPLQFVTFRKQVDIESKTSSVATFHVVYPQSPILKKNCVSSKRSVSSRVKYSLAIAALCLGWPLILSLFLHAKVCPIDIDRIVGEVRAMVLFLMIPLGSLFSLALAIVLSAILCCC